jgi:hypothetical protein
VFSFFFDNLIEIFLLRISPLLQRLKTDFASLRTKQALRKLNICLVGDAKGGTTNEIVAYLTNSC